MECAPSERRLIEEARGGEAAAFGQLVKMHEDRIFGFLYRSLGSYSDAQDVAQTTFLLAWRKFEQFRGDAKLSTWLTRIAVNQAATLRRRKRPLAVGQGGANEERPMDVADSAAEAPSDRAEQAERNALVQDALDRLSPEHREVLLLKEFGRHDYKEISELVGCPIGTVRSRIHRARSELSDLLSPHRETLIATG